MKKPSLILLGGWGQPAAALQPLAASAAAYFDVAAFSVADMAPAYAERLGSILLRTSGPTLLLGWSMGGMIALETTARFPECVAGLILIGSTAKFTADETYPEGIPSQRLRAMAAALKRQPAVVLSRFFTESRAPAAIDPSALSVKVANAIALGIENLRRDLNYLQSSDLRKSARSLKARALVLHGREDRVIPWEAGQWLMDHLPRAVGTLFEGIGHDLPLDHPDLVSSAALDFIRSITDSNDRTVCRRFSAAAGTYDAHAVVQNAIATKLALLISSTPSVGRILEVGCGTGAFTRHLLGRFPHAAIDAIDLSPTMIDFARGNFAAAPTLHWQAADARSFRGGPYELIASNCAMHWIDPLIEGLDNLARLLKPRGELTFSIMLDGTFQELREARRRVAPEKQPMGRLPRLREVVDGLELSGCEVIESLEETETAAYETAADFLQTIHDMGLTGGAVSRAPRPLNRRELDRLLSDYDAHYRFRDGHVFATFKVGYLKAVKHGS